ncbi:MAG TPA: hypothetical protein VGN99_15315 [Steroidobacteraceae bacterium]|nr:hypothetical protein [Steroidobacteraceae bacterium]
MGSGAITGHSDLGARTIFLTRAKSPGADAAAAAHAFEVAAAAPVAATVAPAITGVGGGGAAEERAAAASIGWPQLPQKRAFAGTGLLHLGQFTMFSFVLFDDYENQMSRSNPPWRVRTRTSVLKRMESSREKST